MKIPTWAWILGGAAAAYVAYKYFVQGGGTTVSASMTNIDTSSDGQSIVVTLSITNPGAATQVSGLSVAAAYTNGSIGTGTWSGALAAGTSTISVTIPIQSSVQNDLIAAVNNGNSGYTIQLYGSGPISFTINAPIP